MCLKWHHLSSFQHLVAVNTEWRAVLCEDITSSLAGMFLKYITRDFHFNHKQLLVAVLSLDKYWTQFHLQNSVPAPEKTPSRCNHRITIYGTSHAKLVLFCKLFRFFLNAEIRQRQKSSHQRDRNDTVPDVCVLNKCEREGMVRDEDPSSLCTNQRQLLHLPSPRPRGWRAERPPWEPRNNSSSAIARPQPRL